MSKWLKRHNIGLWALSFAVAVGLWAYAKWELNPEGDKQVSGIKLEITAADSLEVRDLCVLEGGDQTFSLVFTGRQRDLNLIDNESVKLGVDVSGIRVKGEMFLACKLILPEGAEGLVTAQQLPSVRIVFDNVVSDDIEVVLRDNYDIADGYVALSPVLQPYSVRIRGPESIVSGISRAEVELVHENIDSSIENEDLVYALLDESGERIERADLLTADVDSVLVSLPVHVVKEVPLRIGFIDGGGLRENENVICDIAPSSIRISGMAEDMEELNAIFLKTIDLAKLEDELSETVVIPLPENIRNLSGINEAEVTITFSGVGWADVSAANISVINVGLPDNSRIVVVSKSLPVRIRGPKDIVGLVRPEDIRVVADLSGKSLSNSIQFVAAEVYIDGQYSDTVGVMGSYDIIIEVVGPADGQT